MRTFLGLGLLVILFSGSTSHAISGGQPFGTDLPLRCPKHGCKPRHIPKCLAYQVVYRHSEPCQWVEGKMKSIDPETGLAYWVPDRVAHRICSGPLVPEKQCVQYAQ